jgi:hypothetical protein
MLELCSLRNCKEARRLVILDANGGCKTKKSPKVKLQGPARELVWQLSRIGTRVGMFGRYISGILNI